MINEENTIETPEVRAIRFTKEEDELQELLQSNNASGDVADALIEQLARKHDYEMTTNIALSMQEFADIESGVSVARHIAPPDAILDVAVSSENDESMNEGAESIITTSSHIEQNTMSGILRNGNSEETVGGTIGSTIEMMRNLSGSLRTISDAEKFLADSTEINDLTEKLKLVSDERILNKEELAEKRELEKRLHFLESEKERADTDASNVRMSIPQTLDFAVLNFDKLPEELQDGIFYVKDEVLRKHGISRMAANEIANEVGKQRKDAERTLKIQHDKERRQKEEKSRRMAPEVFVKTLETPEFATYNRSEIESILQSAGIPMDKIGDGLKLLKEKYPSEASSHVNESHSDDSFEQKNETHHELDNLRQSFGVILEASEARRAALDELRGNKTWLGLNRGLKSMQKKLQVIPVDTDDQRLLKQKMQLERDITDFKKRIPQAQNKLQEAGDAYASAVGQSIEALDNLLPELAEAIRSANEQTPAHDEVFKKYDLNPEVAQKIAHELIRRNQSTTPELEKDKLVESESNEVEADASVENLDSAQPLLSGVYEERVGEDGELHIYNSGDVHAGAPQLDGHDLSTQGLSVTGRDSVLSRETVKGPRTVYRASEGATQYDSWNDPDFNRDKETANALRRSGGYPLDPKVNSMAPKVGINPQLTGLYHSRDGILHTGLDEQKGEPVNFAVPQKPTIEPNENSTVLLGVTNVFSTKQKTPVWERAEMKRNEKQGLKMQALLGDMAQRAGVEKFSNRQLEEMDLDDNVFDSSGKDTVSESEFEMTGEQIRARSRKAAEVFGMTPEMTLSEFKIAMGLGWKTAERVLTELKQQNKIEEKVPGVFAWAGKIQESVVDNPTPANDSEVPATTIVPEETATQPLVTSATEPLAPEPVAPPVAAPAPIAAIESNDAIPTPVDPVIEDSKGDMPQESDSHPAVTAPEDKKSTPEVQISPSATTETLEAPKVLSPYDIALQEQWDNDVLDVWKSQAAGVELQAEGDTLENLSTEGKQELHSELDELGSLWASFIAREYGMDVDNLEQFDSFDGEIESKGAVLEQLVVNPVDTEDLVSRISSSTESGVSGIPIVLIESFEKKFGLNQETLENIKAFQQLSLGQKTLVFKNLEQITLSDISVEAKRKQQEEWTGMSKGGRLKQQLMTFGMKPEHRRREIEKELLKQQNLSKNSQATPEQISRKATTLAYIESLAKVAASGPDVDIENGELRMKYLSAKNIISQKEDGQINEEQKKQIEDFNSAASEYAKIPHEWTYRDWEKPGMIEKAVSDSVRALGMGKKEQTDFEYFDTTKQKYESARASILYSLKNKFKEEGEESSSATQHAIREISKIDERVSLNQLFQSYPDAEAAMQHIETTSARAYAMKEFWKSKGAFAAYGGGARGIAVAAAGAVASVPTFGASLAIAASLGVGFASAPIAGYFVGRKIGEKQGQKDVEDWWQRGRMSDEDMREEIEYKKYKHIDGVLIKDSNNKPIEEGTGKRQIRTFSEATFFVDRIDKLSAKLENTVDATAQDLLKRKITQTVALMAAKSKHGMINFGSSSRDISDRKKEDVIDNKYRFQEALMKGLFMTSSDDAEIKAIAERQIGERLAVIKDTEREQKVIRVAAEAAKTRAKYAFLGALGFKGAEMAWSASVDVFGTPNMTRSFSAVDKQINPVEPISQSNMGVSGSGSTQATTSIMENQGIPKDPTLIESQVVNEVVKITPKLPSPEDIATSVSAFEKAIGRELSSYETQIVKNLKILEVNSSPEMTRYVGEALSTSMKASAGPLSPEQIHEILKEYTLQDIVDAKSVDSMLNNPVLQNELERVRQYSQLYDSFSPEAKEVMNFAVKMEQEIGRPLIDSETRALWQTSSPLLEPSVDYPQSISGVVHGQLIEAMKAKGTPLSSEEILSILKKGVFEESEGRTVPDGVLFDRDHELETLDEAVSPNSFIDGSGKTPPPIRPDISGKLHMPGVRASTYANDVVNNTRIQVAEINPPTSISPENNRIVNNVIAEKWSSVAQKGVYDNPHWASVRGEKIEDIFQRASIVESALSPKLPTLEAAEWQMKNLIEKSRGMGFSASENETGGQYLDRVALELSQPLSDAQLVERSRNILEYSNSGVDAGEHLGKEFGARRILTEKIPPEMLDTSEGLEYSQVKQALTSIYEKTRVMPMAEEDVHTYAERAIRVLLEKHPTLHYKELFPA